MPLLENIVQGFANAAGNTDASAAIEKQKLRRQGLSDDFRKQKITEAMTIGNNIQKATALLLDPNTLQPIAGKEQQVADLRSKFKQLDSYIKNLYNPNFDPQKGAVSEDPLHKLTDKMRLTKAPQQPQQTDISALQTQFGAEVPREENPYTKKAKQLKDAGFSDQQIKKIQEIDTGLEPKATAPKEHITYAIEPDPESPTGYSKVGYDATSKSEVSRQSNVLPPRGFIASESTTTDPFGVTSTTTRKPVVPGATPGKSSQPDYGGVKPVVPGNIQWFGRQQVPMPEGKTGTVHSFSREEDGLEVLVPTIYDGKNHSEEEAWQHYKQTGQHMGKFKNAADADKFAQKYHQDAEAGKYDKKTPGQMKKDLEGKVSKTGQPQPLDAQGHIPDTAKVNPNLREAANNILDGMDITKLPIPQKDRAAAENLAKQYGWKGQGLFAPGDIMRVRESMGILKQFQEGSTLSVLDDATSRQKVAQVIQNVEKRSMLGQALQTFIAQNLNENEQKFVTLYLQAVGRISGLSQIVRSGRPTEATIERLKTELPNPATTASSAHAKQKLDQIQNEIDIAMDKGQFTDQPSSTDSNSKADEILKKHGVL